MPIPSLRNPVAWTPRHRNRRSRLTRAAVGVLVVCVVVGAVVLALTS
jgi:hypothetical protein